jgi:signal transduction histidine kinase
MIHVYGLKMLSQINSSLELHKIEQGTYTLKPQECSPVQLVRNNIDIFAASKGIDPSLFVIREHASGAERSGLTLQTDGLLLDIVLMNLLGNAMEASDPEAKVLVDISEDGEAFSIAIANSLPVPVELRERFFDKYATAGKVGGTGLGTYSAFIMTRAIGGTIAMETSEESGTKVTVRIPMRDREI